MTVGIIIVVAIVLAVVLIALGRRSSAQTTEAAPAAAPARPDEDLSSFRLEPADFHVDGDTAVVSFDVPATRASADAVMQDLLVRQAIDAVHDRQARGLPIDDISSVRVLAREGDGYVAVTTAELEEPGSVSFPDAHDPEVREADEVEFDPLHRLADRVGTGPSQASVSRGDELAKLSDELRFTGDLEARMRERGIDPATLDATTLTTELLGLAGYTLTAGSAAGTYTASRAGVDTYVALVDHREGEYPELTEQAINSFLAGFYGSSASRGLLFSDKFGPFLVYEKERRDERVRFITRERLQDFVDSIAAL